MRERETEKGEKVEIETDEMYSFKHTHMQAFTNCLFLRTERLLNGLQLCGAQ